MCYGGRRFNKIFSSSNFFFFLKLENNFYSSPGIQQIVNYLAGSCCVATLYQDAQQHGLHISLVWPERQHKLHSNGHHQPTAGATSARPGDLHPRFPGGLATAHSALVRLQLVPEITRLRLAGLPLLHGADRSKGFKPSHSALEPGEAAGATLDGGSRLRRCLLRFAELPPPVRSFARTILDAVIKHAFPR